MRFAYRLVALLSLAVLGSCAEMSIHNLNRRPLDVDTRSISLDLRPPATEESFSGICLLLDTAMYDFHPMPALFRNEPLTDTSIVPRVPGGGEGAPIALRAYLLSNNGARADFPAPRAGADSIQLLGTLGPEGPYTAYTLQPVMKPWRADMEICLAKPALVAGVTYQRLVLRSSASLTIKVVEQHVWTGG